ncbi:MAG: MBL fold metallo-hydrolase [Verrucomicrobiales bacterium]|nr:MBL fold metallo-hydrolase [Verrucomicrobiales bacterium]
MKHPALASDAFLHDVAQARHEPGLHLWWLGQSGFLVLWNHRFLLLDPYLSDSLTRKYAATDKPHVRMTERVIAPERLGFIDVVTSSHNHTDHLDPESLRPLARANPELIMVCPEANRATVRERSGLADHALRGVNAGEQVEASGFQLHAIPAAHETLDVDKSGRHLYLGFVVQAGPYRLVHTGDTVRYDGLAERWIPPGTDVALFPINGRGPERRVAGNLWGAEAAQLARDIRAGTVIPCHYDMFEFNTATPDAFETECRRLGQPFITLAQGARLSLPPRTAPRPDSPS